MKKQKNIRKDIILGSVGIVIAVTSLILSIWQGKETISHNRVSVEPRINSYFSNDGRESKWGIYLINNGLGTAFVSNLTVLVGNKEVKPINNNKFLGAVVAMNLNPLCFVVSGPRPNDSFKVGDEVLLIEARSDNRKCAGDRLILMDKNNGLDYVLEFESIYRDKYRYVYSDNEQVKM